MLAVVAGFLAPAATAAWTSFGDVEPNTVYDTPEFMFADADTSAADQKVYLNAFSASGYTLTSQNPNNHITESRVYPAGTLYFYAALGIWKDCNGDGYMGMAEGALVTYRAELLGDDTICPAANSVHNDGQWVTELQTIGMVNPCLGYDKAHKENPDHACYGAGDFIPRPGVIYANGTRLWTDAARPDQPHGGAGSCAIRPHDRGTFSNTGMMLRAADCIVGYRVANTVNQIDSDGSLGLYFQDPKNPHHGNSLLSQNLPVSTFGNPNNGQTGLLEQDTDTFGKKEPTATVWSCSNGQASPSVSTASDPTDASLYNTVDYAFDGITVGTTEGKQVVAAYNTQVRPVLNQLVNDAGVTKNPDYFSTLVVAWNDCNSDTRNELGSAYYEENVYGQNPGSIGWVEGQNSPTATFKNENDFHYTFFAGGYDPRSATNQVILGTLGQTTPPGAGVSILSSLYGPMWSARTVYLATPQLINRATLGASSASYWTTYAYVATDSENFPAGAQFPGNGVTFTYGQDQCQGATTGEVNGWQCDPAKWYLDSNKVQVRAMYPDKVTPLGAIVGEPYHLRDTECYDGTIQKGLFVRASLTDLSPSGPCLGSAPGPLN